MSKIQNFNLFAYNKALVALIVPAIIVILQNIGFPVSDEITASIGVLVTGFFVWLVPNK